MKKLGFGFMRLPLLDKDEPTSINYIVLNEMVDTFMQRGFCYFDTAYMYHNSVSEVAIREAVVKRYPRERFLLADKMPMMMLTSKAQQEEIFQTQLERCGVEYFDNYLLHNLGTTNYQSALQYDSFAYVSELKQKGLAKRIGFSYHDNAQLLDEILTNNPQVDFVQLQINYLDWETESIQSRKCYEVAQKHGKPVIVMEPLKGGVLANIPEQAQAVLKACRPDLSVASWGLRYAASLPNVELVLSGMSDLAQLEDNTAYMKDFQPLSAAEQQAVASAKQIIADAIAIPCTGCQYCVESCPQKIAIPQYFSLYNDKHYYGTISVLPQLYYDNLIKNHGKASTCIECRQCEAYCPQKLAIVDLLKDVASAFEA